MKTEILKVLRERGDYVSGQQLCEHFHVSRTAVWKAINQLKEEGYEVEAVRNKGYRITSSPDVITKEELASQMDTKWAGQELYCFDEIDSTNTKARQLGDQGASHGTLVVSDCQRTGRGRRGRVWESPKGKNIYMSLLLRPEFSPDKAAMLTLVMALSVYDGLKENMDLDLKIKWPNDIVCGGRKLVGILTEMSTEIDYINHVVIGTGINVNIDEFPEELKEMATSLKIETGCRQKRSTIITSVLRNFEKNYKIYTETCDLSKLQDKYNSILINKDQEVRILGEKQTYTAYALGINEKGELLVRKPDGSVNTIYAGEVSVRGLYGYTS